MTISDLNFRFAIFRFPIVGLRTPLLLVILAVDDEMGIACTQLTTE